MLSESHWENVKKTVCNELTQPNQQEVKTQITTKLKESANSAIERFPNDDFAEILDGKLKLKRYDKADVPANVIAIQKVIDTRLPTIRIEHVLREVDQATNFSRHFTPIQDHQSRPQNFL